MQQKAEGTNTRVLQDVATGFPVSPLQEVMLRDGQHERHCQIKVVFRLPQVLELEAIEYALSTIVAEQEILRTSFGKLNDGQLVQVIHEEVNFHWARANGRDIWHWLNLPNSDEASHQIDRFDGEQYRCGIACENGETLLAMAFDKAILDRVSLVLLEQELCNLTDVNPLPSIVSSMQYADISEWMLQLGEEEQQSENVFLMQLFENLPRTRQPGNPATGFWLNDIAPNYQHAQFRLPGHIVSAIDEFANQLAMSSESIYLSAYFLFLHQLSGQHEICLHYLNSGRRIAELDAALGLFDMPVPLALNDFNLSQNGLLYAVDDMLQRVNSTDQFYHLYQQIEALSDLKLSQFGFEFFEASQGCFDHVTVNGDSSHILLLSIDMQHVNVDEAPGVSLNWQLNGRWGPSSQNVLAQRYIQILESVISGQISRQESDNWVISDTERNWLEQFSSYSSQPGQTRFFDKFRERVKSLSDKDALLYNGSSYSYQKLNQHVSALAADLDKSGVTRGDVVMIATPDTVLQVIAILASHALGAAFVAVDSQWPLARIAFIAVDAKAKAVIGEPDIEQKLSTQIVQQGGTSCCLTYDLNAVFSGQKEFFEPESVSYSGDDIAYIVYTSGSTGTPKGVLITQSNLITYLEAFATHIDFSQVQSLAGLGTIAADLTYTTLFSALYQGKTLRLFSNETLVNADKLCHELYEQPVDMIKTVPTFIRALAALDNSGRFLPKQYLICGGELFDSSLRTLLQELQPDCQVFNHYGPCETTIGVTMQAVSLQQNVHEGNVPVGAPMGQSTSLQILDEQLRQVPIGIPGELCIGGSTLGAGYLNQNQLTSTKWFPNPANSAEQLYRSGDLARFRIDGSIEVLGRIDQQVKIRGFRVEISEIESRLLAHSAVTQVSVSANMVGHQWQLIAFIIAVKDLAEEALRIWCSEFLPAHAVPGFFSLVEEFPKLSNGKVDRKQLLTNWQEAQVKAKLEYSSEAMAKTADIFASLLGLSAVKEQDDFFKLGGNSILAIRATAALHKAFDTNLTPGDLFTNPTVESITHFIQQSPPAISEVPLVKLSEEQPVPMSPAQYRLWLMGKLSHGHHFHVPFIFEVGGELNVKRLAKAFDCVIARHNVLRSHFVMNDGAPLVKIARPETVHIEQTTLNASVDVASHIATLIETPFDIESQASYRFSYLRLEERSDILVILFHHLVIDGWSLDLLVNEVYQFYNQQDSANTEKVLQPLTWQYQDYAAWQNQLKTSQCYRELLSEATAWLADTDTSIDLPVKDANQAFRAPFTAARKVIELDSTETNLLLAKGREQGLTPYMSLLAVFALLLSRYSGQKDLIIGSISSDRGKPELEDLIGVFFNLLPVKLEVDTNQSIPDYMKAVRHSCNRSRRYQNVAFDDLVEQLSPERSSGQPLFNVLFYVQDQLKQEWRKNNHDWQLKSISAPLNSVNYELTLAIEISEGRFNAVFEYAQERFDEKCIDLLVHQYQHLISGIARQNFSTLAEVSWQPTTLAMLEGPSVDGTKLDVLTKISSHAMLQANKIAIQYESEQLTYQQLWQRIEEVAVLLEQLPAKSRIGICCHRHKYLAADILGIMQAKHIYVPIDPATPFERVQQVSEDAQLNLVLADEQSRKLFSNAEVMIVDIDPLQSEPAKLAKDPETVSAIQTCSDSSYILFTSGSSGRPKGVEISSSSLNHFLDAMAQRLPLTPDVHWLAGTTIAFDISILELFMPLYVGGTLNIAKGDVFRDVDKLKELVAQGANVLQATPSMWALLVADPTFPALKLALSGGEALPLSLAKELLENHHQVWNLYGPTETTIWAAATQLTPDKLKAGSVPIAEPLANTQFYVLDDKQQLLAQDMVGELAISGDLVGEGYINRPDLNPEVFREGNLLSTYIAGRNSEHKYYLTGDRVRIRQDGDVQFLGRFGSMLKLNGYRIDLGDIESTAQEHHEINQAVASVLQSQAGNQQLVLYVVSSGAELTLAPDWQAKIIDWLKTKIPAYMVPTTLVHLDEIPTTQSGKVDRKNLPEIELAASDAQQYAELDSQAEKLHSIWREFFPDLPSDMTSNWFALGGGSISMVIMLGRVMQVFGIEVPIFKFYQAATLEGLNQLLNNASRCQIKRKTAIVDPFPNQGPLTRIQEGIFAAQNSSDVGSTYHMSVCLRMEGSLDVEQLQHSFGQMLNVQSQLKTGYRQKSGELMQFIVEEPQLALQAVDIPLTSSQIVDVLQANSLEELNKSAPKLANKISKAVNHPLHLANGEVIRASLLRIKPELNLLVLAVHHIAMDEWSWRPLLQQWFSAYSGERLAQPPINFIGYAKNQRKQDDLESDLEYWKSLMRDAPPLLEMNFAKRRAAKRNFSGGMIDVSLSPETTLALEAIAEREETTMYSVLASIYVLTLYHFSHRKDVVWGTAVANRFQPELFDLVGCFTNIIPCRVKLKMEISYLRYLHDLQQTISSGLASQQVPYPTLVENLCAHVSPAYAPVVQNFFVYHNTPKVTVKDSSLGIKSLKPKYKHSEYDLDLGLDRDEQKISGYFRFNSGLYDAQQVDEIWQCFSALCEILGEHSGLSLADMLSTLETSDEQELVVF